MPSTAPPAQIASFKITNAERYSSDVAVLKFKVTGRDDVTDAPPGKTNVFVTVALDFLATNRTTGRAMESPSLLPYVIFPSSSALCAENGAMIGNVAGASRVALAYCAMAVGGVNDPDISGAHGPMGVGGSYEATHTWTVKREINEADLADAMKELQNPILALSSWDYEDAMTAVNGAASALAKCQPEEWGGRVAWATRPLTGCTVPAVGVSN